MYSQAELVNKFCRVGNAFLPTILNTNPIVYYGSMIKSLVFHYLVGKRKLRTLRLILRF